MRTVSDLKATIYDKEALGQYNPRWTQLWYALADYEYLVFQPMLATEGSSVLGRFQDLKSGAIRAVQEKDQQLEMAGECVAFFVASAPLPWPHLVLHNGTAGFYKYEGGVWRRATVLDVQQACAMVPGLGKPSACRQLCLCPSLM